MLRGGETNREGEKMIPNELSDLVVPIKDLKHHPRNVRQGDVGAISESLKENGQYRPIVVQKATGHVLAGNHTLKAAKALGWKEIAVTYIDCDDDRALRILLADNRTNDLATYDDSALADLLKELANSDLGFAGTTYDGDELDRILGDIGEQQPTDEDLYTQKVKIPQYEIVGEEPQTIELLDTTKADQLRQNIDKADLPEDIRNFLIAGTWRHIKFNYRKIAEFYPHQPKEIQELMEQSVLVIIDADDAIANGYAKFKRTLEDLMDKDDDHE
jgi:hypothetical protein